MLSGDRPDVGGKGDSFLAGSLMPSAPALSVNCNRRLRRHRAACGGVTEASTAYEWGAADGTPAPHLAGSDEKMQACPDGACARLIAIGPLGPEQPASVDAGKAPVGPAQPDLPDAAAVDDVSGYEDGVRRI